MALLISTSERVAEEIKRERSGQEIAFMLRQTAGKLSEDELRGFLLAAMIEGLGHNKTANDATAKLLSCTLKELRAAIASAAFTLASMKN